MTVNQMNKLDMYLALLAVLAEFEQVWSQLPAFARGVSSFQGTIRELQNLAQTQFKTGGAAGDKARALRELADLAVQVAAGVRVRAHMDGDLTLADKMRISRWSLVNGSSAAAPLRCREIHQAAVEGASLLAEYGVTQERVDRLQKAIERFEVQLTRPREMRVAGKASRKQLRELFQQADAILRLQLDELCVQFEPEQARFCDEFAAARLT